jgi:hypothetical protein
VQTGIDMQLTDTPVDVVHNGIDSIVHFGLPIKKGLVWRKQHIELLLNNEILDYHLVPTGFWDDNSIRWISVDAVVTRSGSISLNINKNIDIVSTVEDQKERKYSFQNNTVYENKWFPFSLSIELKLDGQLVPIKLNNIVDIFTSNEILTNHEISGQFSLKNKQLFVNISINEVKLTGQVCIETKIHNPAAAAHVDGKWDLGDSNSVIIDDFSIVFQSQNTSSKLLLADSESSKKTKILEKQKFTLSQFGSGGANWKSPIHWNQHKESTVEKQGYEVKSDDGELREGLRAIPTLIISNEKSSLQVALEDFWQNFPINLSIKGNGSKWKLLSNKSELQGGESKTWRLNCRSIPTYTIDKKNIEEQAQLLAPTIKFNADYLNTCKVFPHLALCQKPSNFAKFINLGIEGKHSFFNKREKNDVFGWRNYGEIDADHEAVNAPADSYFISHYNNQYDPLMGMTLQYLHTANPKWLALIHPLNQHIQDIDIYDTTEDKAEYNGGLMWHTDHYLPAETSTHRSNSKYHKAAYEGFLGGGGPGGQHCYTTGLMLQYRLFGDESAKTKVIQLCNWIRCFYNGSGSIAERTFRLLTMDIKQNVLTNIGFKAPGYKYPLDRGTGNYLTALLDCFDLTENIELLKEMGLVVRGTFHPNENIELRDLNNIEKSWFYTVYLQAVVKYLLLKETRESIDNDYWYARHALMHYGEWMLSNESFYLSNSDQLEFPNDTWCAQDTRKMNLFCYFYYFSSKETNAYLHKANEYYAYIVKHMESSNEVHFARILALLMQNDGVTQKFGLDDPKVLAPRSSITYEEKEFNDAPKFSRYTILKNYLKDVTKLLLHFSPKLEWKWLYLRVRSVLNK